MRSLSLPQKLMVLGISLTLIPLLIVAFVARQSLNETTALSRTGFGERLEAELTQVLENVVAETRLAQTLLSEQTDVLLRTANYLYDRSGGLVVDPTETHRWEAVNQFTRSSQTVTLPAFRLGSGEALPPTFSPDQPLPFIDDFATATGATITLFQRMNEEGDFLRVATNVVTNEGRRAAGTYIPARNPDGKPNPVIATVLDKQTFRGRAFVVNQWYVTAYQPLLDERGRVFAILYVGQPESTATREIKETISKLQVGNSGYAYVLNTRGEARGVYVVSHGGARDHENILDTRALDGSYPIREIVAQGEQLAPGEIARYSYVWKNPEDPAPRQKTAVFAYFAPWDWLIAVSAYDDDKAIFGLIERIEGQNRSALVQTGLVTVVAGLLAAVIFLLFSRRLGIRLRDLASHLAHASNETLRASEQVANSGQVLAEATSEQAASIQTSAATLEELDASTKQNATQAGDSSRRMEDSAAKIEKMAQRMQEITATMRQIADSSNETRKIIQRIDEIAFQTNILALNAAVEAARAGEAGAGFAVVADEVRSLAQRAAEAARDTAGLIDGVTGQIEAGTHAVEQTNADFGPIAESARTSASEIAAIANASDEQSRGLQSISSSVAQMDAATQQTAGTAEEAASAAEELSAQARELDTIVVDLHKIVQGERGSPQSNGASPSLAAKGKQPALTASASDFS